MPHLNKTLAFAVHFARFAGELGIPAPDLGQMIAAAKAGANAYARNDDKAYQRHTAKVEEIAKLHGCKVDWPGLWPCIQKGDDARSNQLLPAYE